jgi:ankyrin repeat protein
MAYACQRNEIGTIEAFLDSKIVKVGAGQGKDRMSPLHWAAAAGNYELCEFLLERKARTLSKDKYARTPLTIACKNGHVKVASLLLQYGSEWNHKDSSGNSVLHYATAFGWSECMDLLISHGADINS